MSENGFPSPETVFALLIVTTVIHVFALISTSFRLWFRYHTRRLRCDDLWAALALFCDIVNMAVMWTASSPLDDQYVSYEALPIPPQSRSVHIVSTWLAILSYTCTIWFSRISIASSVVRIVPPAETVSRAAFYIGLVFLCMWAYMLTCKSVACSINKSWYNTTAIECPIPTWLALSEVCTDSLSDIVLVVFPLYLLWRVKLPLNQRIMIRCVFSASMLVSVVSAIHTVYLIPQATFIGALTAQIGGAVSLIVCNLLVIVTFVYRVIRNGRDLTAGLSDKQAESSRCLTTVDLDFTGSSLFASGMGAESGFASSGFTRTTDISSLVFAGRCGGDMTLGSVAVSSSGSDLPSAGLPLAPITTKK